MNLKSAGRGTIPRLITLTLVVFATTTAGIVAGAVPAQAGSYHGTPCGDNGSDNYMKRSDALARGRSWVADGVTYSQSLCYVDSHGDYRTDCSGFVAMAWGIGGRGSDWASHAVEIDTNPSITQVAAASLPNGTLHVFTLVPGSGTWERVRSASGTWAASAIHIDTNGSVTDIASAGLPDGTLHFQGLVPGSGIWDKTRSTS